MENNTCKKELLENLKNTIRFYEFLSKNPSAYDDADFMARQLLFVVEFIGLSICPPGCISTDDIIKWVKEY